MHITNNNVARSVFIRSNIVKFQLLCPRFWQILIFDSAIIAHQSNNAKFHSPPDNTTDLSRFDKTNTLSTKPVFSALLDTSVILNLIIKIFQSQFTRTGIRIYLRLVHCTPLQIVVTKHLRWRKSHSYTRKTWNAYFLEKKISVIYR